MVSYQEWFGIVQSVASEKASGDMSQQQRGNLTSDLAAYWNANKSELQAMTTTQARQRAISIVSV